MYLITRHDFETREGQRKIVMTIHNLERKVKELEQKVRQLEIAKEFLERDL